MDWLDRFGFLAWVFGWPPSELDDLELDDVYDWVQQATKWAKRGGGRRGGT